MATSPMEKGLLNFQEDWMSPHRCVSACYSRSTCNDTSWCLIVHIMRVGSPLA